MCSMYDDYYLIILFFIGMMPITGVIIATSGDELAPLDRHPPHWIQQMKNNNQDPTSEPGFGCNHGHKSFGCDKIELVTPK